MAPLTSSRVLLAAEVVGIVDGDSSFDEKAVPTSQELETGSAAQSQAAARSRQLETNMESALEWKREKRLAEQDEFLSVLALMSSSWERVAVPRLQEK